MCRRNVNSVFAIECVISAVAYRKLLLYLSRESLIPSLFFKYNE